MGKEQELRRCPFCQATPHKGLTKVQHDQLHGEPFQRYRIWCPHGCASIDRINEGQAREAWNCRPDEVVTNPRVQAVATFLEGQVGAFADMSWGFYEGLATATLATAFPRRSSSDEAEVVAWRVKDFADGWIFYTDEKRARTEAEIMAGALVEPLCRAPKAAGVTEALTQARNFIADDFGDASDAHEILAVIDAALSIQGDAK